MTNKYDGTRRKELPSAEVLRANFDYDAATGNLVRKKVVGARGSAIAMVGQVAGYKDERGYIRVALKGRLYPAHRLIFVMMHGRPPKELVDHIDGNPANNRPENLREASYAENQANQRLSSKSKSGLKGAIFCNRWGKWRSVIRVNGSSKFLGHFENADAAHAAYCAAAEIYFGNFARSA